MMREEYQISTASPQKLRFLMVDDDQEDAYLIEKLLVDSLGESNFQLDVAVTCEDFFNKLKPGKYDLYLLDYRMDVSSGLDLLKILKKNNCEEPVIVLTGQGNQNTVVEALRLGATDYVVKSNLTAETLNHSIQRGLRLYRDTQQGKLMQNRLALQKSLLAGLSEATSCLLRSADHKSGITHALEVMAKACPADAAALIEKSPLVESNQGKWSLSSLWASPNENNTDKAISETLLNIGSYPKLHSYINDFEKGLERDAVFQNGIFGFSKNVLVPVRVHDRFWGFIIFGTNQENFLWNEELKSTLKTFSVSLGWELKRDREGQALQELVQQTSGETGDAFFEALVVHLAKALEVRTAYVCEIVESGLSYSQPLKGWDGSKIVGGSSFDLINTPAEEILCGMYSYYPERTKTLFPHLSYLQETNIEGFAAVPFYDTSGKLMGHISIMSENPLTDSERVLSILRLFGARAGAELERQKSESKIRNMAYYDSLTGLPNRVLLNDRMDVALRQARRNKDMVAILYLDFDHFKNINDTYGHLSGDLFLKEGARRLEACLRKGDTVSRLGGDEFVIVLPEIKEVRDIARLALKINGTVKPPFMLEGTEIKTSVSVGISIFPKDGDTSKTLLQKADKALFFSKNAGRDSFHFADSE
ncbi:MAG: GGDEF domain-containing response regulator [Candidatus Nitronauta litoralis]|uniref:GGDEF domain-containing response regulator n=1 Tax=Candidatus Nitronauta litoralis TaxID=2705533 RepID=A0A7T0BYF0_9BACT|nr:MAG: GGDEF domain-containing response regulator [Candidatus Nitronauta litoralis]